MCQETHGKVVCSISTVPGTVSYFNKVTVHARADCSIILQITSTVCQFDFKENVYRAWAVSPQFPGDGGVATLVTLVGGSYSGVCYELLIFLWSSSERNSKNDISLHGRCEIWLSLIQSLTLPMPYLVVATDFKF